MKNFHSANGMWRDAVTQCVHGTHVESRFGTTREVRGGYAGRLLDVTKATLLCGVRKFCPTYAAAEFLWYLHDTPSTKMIQAYAPQYKEMADKNGDAPGYSYGWRFATNPGFRHDRAYVQYTFDGHTYSQLDAVVDVLRKKPDSRQAVVAVWDSGDIHLAISGAIDPPCTICLHFLLRDGRLDCSAFMRSNDVWLGMPYDVWCFTTIQRMIASRLGAYAGVYGHHVGSMHAYEKDLDKIPTKFEDGYCDVPGDGYFLPTQFGDPLHAKRVEEDARISVREVVSMRDVSRITGTLMGDCAWLCACKTTGENPLGSRYAPHINPAAVAALKIKQGEK